MLFAAAAVLMASLSLADADAGGAPVAAAEAWALASALLLLTPPLPRWAQLLFPLWVMAISVHVLRRERSETATPE